MSGKALFLDRDGVVNELVFYPDWGEWEAPRHVRDVQLCPGAAEAVRRARERGWKVFLVTNQPSFAKGKCALADLQEVHRHVLAELERNGAAVDGSYLCFHHPQSEVPGYGACQCRKPSPFFLLQAAREHDLDLRRSWMAGDRDSDVEAGQRAGCMTALLHYEHSQAYRASSGPDHVFSSLAELVQHLD